jgi:hypothetical protein
VAVACDIKVAGCGIMEEEVVRVGAFGDRVDDFKHLEKAVVWLQLGDDGEDDNVKEFVRIEITSQSNLFDEICKLHAFRDWGVKVFARRGISKNKRGEGVVGFCNTVYIRGWSEDRAKYNMTQLQTWLLEHPSREACYVIMTTPLNSVDVERPVTSGTKCGGLFHNCWLN